MASHRVATYYCFLLLYKRNTMSQQPNCFERLWQDRYGKNVQEDVRLFLDNMLACSFVAGLLILLHQ